MSCKGESGTGQSSMMPGERARQQQFLSWGRGGVGSGDQRSSRGCRKGRIECLHGLVGGKSSGGVAAATVRVSKH